MKDYEARIIKSFRSCCMVIRLYDSFTARGKIVPPQGCDILLLLEDSIVIPVELKKCSSKKFSVLSRIRRKQLQFLELCADKKIFAFVLVEFKDVIISLPCVALIEFLKERDLRPRRSCLLDLSTIKPHTGITGTEILYSFGCYKSIKDWFSSLKKALSCLVIKE